MQTDVLASVPITTTGQFTNPLMDSYLIKRVTQLFALVSKVFTLFQQLRLAVLYLKMAAQAVQPV